MKEHDCIHVRSGARPAVTTMQHTSILGAPTVADDLATSTRLCAVCSGAAVAFLQRAESEGKGLLQPMDPRVLDSLLRSDQRVDDMEAQELDEWDESQALAYAAEVVWAAWTRGANERLPTLMNVLRVALDRVAEAPEVEPPELNFDHHVSPTFQGVNAARCEMHPDELAAAQLWEAENTQAASLVRRTDESLVSSWEPSGSLLGRLLSRDEDRGITPSTRDWLVASTVVQWLGTLRGRTFFTQLQMAIAEKSDR